MESSCVPKRAWINQPSTLQPLHHVHGKNVLVTPDTNGAIRITFTEGPVTSLRSDLLWISPGWNEKGT